MKNKLAYLVALLLATGCSTDETYDNGTEGLVPMRFTGGIEVQTRAHTGMDAQYPAGRSVAFYVYNATTSAQLYGNNPLTTDGSGGFTGGEPMYFPKTDDNVIIYAMHTNGPLDVVFPELAITHTVAADQRAETDYYNSDLLYAVNQNVAKTTDGIPMTFYHLLSKVRIAVAPGTAETDLAGATIQIVGTQVSADFTPSMGVEMSVQKKRAAMVVASGTAEDITVSNELSADFTAANVRYNDAVVVPQVVAGSTAFIRVTLPDNRVLEWSPETAFTLESGKQYTYHVTLTRTGLNVTLSVTRWEDDMSNYLSWLERMMRLGISFVKIPAGSFSMGQKGVAMPVHRVTLSKGFYMSRYEITNIQYAAFLNEKGIESDGKGSVTYYKDNFDYAVTEMQPFIMTSTSSSDFGLHWETDKWVPAMGCDNHPVIDVSWYGAKAFADWVSGALPTEAQWEYACRAGSIDIFSFGSADSYRYMWFKSNSDGTTHAVGTRKPNAWGLYDMHGNVAEWCSDWYGPYESWSVTDPVGPDRESSRVLRGGSYFSDDYGCYSALRFGLPPEFDGFGVGFRVVCPIFSF